MTNHRQYPLGQCFHFSGASDLGTGELQRKKLGVLATRLPYLTLPQLANFDGDILFLEGLDFLATGFGLTPWQGRNVGRYSDYTGFGTRQKVARKSDNDLKQRCTLSVRDISIMCKCTLAAQLGSSRVSWQLPTIHRPESISPLLLCPFVV